MAEHSKDSKIQDIFQKFADESRKVASGKLVVLKRVARWMSREELRK